jgi:hypothetical protein
MKGLGSQGMAIALLILAASVGSYVSALALLNARASASRPVQPKATVPLPAGSLVEVATGPDCRRVIGGRYPLFTSADSYGEEIRYLYEGQRVRLIQGSATRGPDGELYVQVAVPYGVNNPDIGFMPARARSAVDGDLRPTLGLCVPGYWGDGSGDDGEWGDRYPPNDDDTGAVGTRLPMESIRMAAIPSMMGIQMVVPTRIMGELAMPILEIGLWGDAVEAAW